MASATSTSGSLRRRAQDLGFDVCRVTHPGGIGQAGAGLAAFLAARAHGTMDWMQTTAERRADPCILWPEARSIIMLGMNYGAAGDPLAVLAQPDRGAISVYARNRDYHQVIKGKLKTLAQWLLAQPAARRSDGGEVKVFVDTAPVMEKPLAAAAGVGWQGKHTNLVSRDFGSWLFLGSIFTTLELPPDAAMENHCGACQACLDVCPTRAFPAPYKIDARRCISYLTIEYKGHIGRAFRAAMGNRIYGCDDCLAVCPWNKFAQAAREVKLAARPELEAPELATLLALDDVGFRALFSASPVKRIGYARFMRNVLIAAGNSGHAPLLPLIVSRLCGGEAIVRAMAVWALSRLVDRKEVKRMADRHLADETDPHVRGEWQEALADV